MLHHDHPSYPSEDLPGLAPGLTPVGVVRLDDDGPWLPLVIDDVRVLHAIVDGEPVALDKEESGAALYEALNVTCQRLWGHSWNSAVGEVFRMNRRTTQRDRVTRNLLPPRVLQKISYVASADDTTEMANGLIAAARYWARFKGDEAVTRRYWQNVMDVFLGDADADIAGKR